MSDMFVIEKCTCRNGVIYSNAEDNFYVYCPISELKYILEDTRGSDLECWAYFHQAIRCSDRKLISLEEVFGK